jgi:hypothetical protein
MKTLALFSSACDRRWQTRVQADIIHLYPFVSAGNPPKIARNSTFFAYSGKKSLKKILAESCAI